ncbi:hypothetical protein [Rhodococcus sp. T2V]|uniref:hypothetical protein n=1 Tax=Rhodococcus sp. T2V TaxID=3034164 RepID=UPI0023E24F34|nr:hypothetical protein [Rhodococcus sp. T2V]
MTLDRFGQCWSDRPTLFSLRRHWHKRHIRTQVHCIDSTGCVRTFTDIHVLIRILVECGVGRNVGAEELTSRDVRHAVGDRERLFLRTVSFI